MGRGSSAAAASGPPRSKSADSATKVTSSGQPDLASHTPLLLHHPADARRFSVVCSSTDCIEAHANNELGGQKTVGPLRELEVAFYLSLTGLVLRLQDILCMDADGCKAPFGESELARTLPAKTLSLYVPLSHSIDTLSPSVSD